MTARHIPGDFWHAATRMRSDGEIVLGDYGQRPVLSVHRQIIQEKAVKITRIGDHELQAAYGGSPTDIVEDYKPRTFLGEAEDGTKLTLIGAQGGYNLTGLHGLGQEFRCYAVVEGDHVDEYQRYSHARYLFDGPWKNVVISDRESFHAIGGGGLEVYRQEASTWIEVQASNGASLREYETRILIPLMSFLAVAGQCKISVSRMNVRSNSDSPWLEVHPSRSPEFPARASRPGPIPIKHLTLERAASWIDASEKAEGLIEALAGLDESLPIETQVITLAAVAEGMHRRFHCDKVAFPELNKAQRRAVRKAAKDAATAQLAEFGINDHDRIDPALDGPLAQINDMKFRERMRELAEVARCFDPEIVSDFHDWTKSVAEIRNKFVHQLMDDDDECEQPWNPEESRVEKQKFYNLATAVGYSLSWVLKLNLLAHGGFERGLVSSEILQYEPYEYSRAYVASLISDSAARSKGGIQD